MSHCAPSRTKPAEGRKHRDTRCFGITAKSIGTESLGHKSAGAKRAAFKFLAASRARLRANRAHAKTPRATAAAHAARTRAGKSARSWRSGCPAAPQRNSRSQRWRHQRTATTRSGSEKKRSRACCDAPPATPEAPETHVSFGATRVGTLLSRLQMHLRTARFLARVRQDAVWERGCEGAAMSLEQLESEMSPSGLHASIRPRVAAAQRGRAQRRVHSSVQPKPRSGGPSARTLAMSRAAARSVAANTAATFATLQCAARNCKRTLAAPPAARALAVRRRSTVRTSTLFPGALTSTPVNWPAVPPQVKPLVSRSAGTLTALAKGQR